MDKQLFTVQDLTEITGQGRSHLYDKHRNAELRSLTVRRAIEDFVQTLEEQCSG